MERMTKRPPSEGPAAAQEAALSRRGRLVAIVLAATMASWLAVQWLGGALGLPGAWVFAADLAALAAFGWALLATHGIWRRRQEMKE